MSFGTASEVVRTVANRPAHVALAGASAGLAVAAIAPGLVSSLPVLALLAALVVTSFAHARSRGWQGPATFGTDRLEGGDRTLQRRVPSGGGRGRPDGLTATGRRASGAIVPRVAEAGLLAVLAFAGGAAVGQARLTSIDRFDARVHADAPIATRAHMLAHPRPGPLGSSVELQMTAGALRGARLLARLPRWAGTLDGVPIGAELRLRGRLHSLAQIAAEDRTREFQVADWLRQRRVAGELLLDRVRATGRRRDGLAGVLDRLRDRAERAVAAGLREDQAALLRGMVLGQDEAIEETVRDEFKASGLSHILAVSGQNVMLLAALALPALMAAGLGAPGRALALLALIALYVPLAGAGPSLQRAGIMGAAALAAMLAARPASRSYALLLAAVSTLLLNPRAVGDPGWQLSFAAVAGILVIGRPLARGLREAIQAGGSAAAASVVAADRSTAARLARAAANALADGVAITVAATLATAPLLAHHFGTVSLASLPANVLALPVVAPAMWLGMLKAAVGQLALAGLPADAMTGALGSIAGLPLTVISTLAERFARLPAGQLRVELHSPMAIGLAYGVLAAALLVTRTAAPSLVAHVGEAGSRWRRLPPRTRAAVVAAIAAGAALFAAEELAPPRPPEALTVRFLDVGQGDATLIQHPDGTAILFDGGPPEGGVARQLRRAGVRRLALVVATHASRDHHGGLRSVLTGFPVDLLLDGGDGTRDPSFRAIEEEADRRGIRRVAAMAPLDLRAGALHVRVLSPPPRLAGPPPGDPNPRAVTAIVSAGGFDLLLSADAESPTLSKLALPDVDAMKLPHHGSADPGLPDLLERLRPEAAGITVGTNTYGHPAPSTLTALRRAGVSTWRTDRDGTVTITIAGGDMHVEAER